MTAPGLAGVLDRPSLLSSYFGHHLTGEQPLAGDPSSSMLADPGKFMASPDTLLAENTVPAPQLPTLPPAVKGTRNEPGTVPAPPGAAAPHGDAALAIGAAMGYVGTMYEWGGTGKDGRVDCSGLLYAAFNQAGIKMPRYRAVDYGHMGAAIGADQARPGDIVYFDEPGDTDHVGLYVGNGKFIEAPTQGQQVRVSPLRRGAQLRRILPDSALNGIPVDPNGRMAFHSDNQVFTSAGKAPPGHPGVQRDPLEQLRALDAAQSLGAIEHTSQVSSILDSFAGASPDSIFGQAHSAAMDLAGFTQPPGRPGPAGPAPSGSGHGLTVGQATGLSASEAWIITHESSGQTGADNPKSTAFGFGQLLAGNRQMYGKRFGFSPDTTDPAQQLIMFRAYYKDRYGTAENAEKFWRENGWY